jgi:hypothetical protein
MPQFILAACKGRNHTRLFTTPRDKNHPIGGLSGFFLTHRGQQKKSSQGLMTFFCFADMRLARPYASGVTNNDHETLHLNKHRGLIRFWGNGAACPFTDA